MPMMKHLVHTPLLALVLTTLLPAEVATRFASEWSLPLVHTGAGFAVIDGETGHTRIARVDGSGGVTWTPPIATGIDAPSDVAGGLFDGSDELILLTSPDANRVVLLDAALTLPFPRVLFELSGIGPSGLAAVGNADRELMVSSVLNGITRGGFEMRGSISKSAFLSAETLPSSIAADRLQPLGAPGSAGRIAIYTEASGANTRVGLTARDGGAVVSSLKGTFSGQVQLASNVESSNFPTRSYTVAWRAGSNLVNLLNASTPVTTASTITSTSVNLAHPVSAIIPVPAGGIGDISEGIIAIRANGTSADVYFIDETGDSFKQVGDPIDAAPGQFLSAIIPHAMGGYTRLGSATLGGRSSSWENFQFDGKNWISTSQGVLDPLPDDDDATRATLLFFDGDPALAESARLLGQRELAAWTRRTTNDAVPDTVVAETFTSSADGLTSIGSEAVLAPPGTGYVVASQVDPGVSIVPLAGARTTFQPALEISPPSGHYTHTLQVTARFNTNTHALRFRKDDGPWLAFPAALPVAWDGEYEFMLESLTAAARGGIVRRSYTFDKAAIATLDSDGDGVPDFVEELFGLDPFGGPDSDGDGFSDLDEILAGKDPNDAGSVAAERLDLGRDGGLAIAALAASHTGQPAVNGTELAATTVTGATLAAAAVDDVDPVLPDGTSRAAILRSSTALPIDEAFVLSTPLYFTTTGGTPQGREIIRLQPADPPVVFRPSFTPVGDDLSHNAGLWLDAATALANTWAAIPARTDLAPADSAVAVLVEEMVHAAWLSLPGANGTPVPLDQFTLFAGRETDRLRVALDPAAVTALGDAGFSMRAALDLANSAAHLLAPVANGAHQRHVASAAGNPALVLPLDAMRILLRTNTVPDGYSGAVSSGDLTAARNAYAAVIGQAGQAYRPLASWTVEILETPPAPGVYRRTSDAALVALLDENGATFTLERGLGLAPGSRFVVTGFSDTPSVGGLPSLQVRAALFDFRPAASDRDTDANLLDDEWERFFFGATGQNPFSEPHGGGFPLLQYFLQGIDPRTGELPAGAPLVIDVANVAFKPAPGGGYHLDFAFPEGYEDFFTFEVERSLTLGPGSFTTIPGTTTLNLGGGLLRATIPAGQAPPGKAFFRIAVALAP